MGRVCCLCDRTENQRIEHQASGGLAQRVGRGDLQYRLSQNALRAKNFSRKQLLTNMSMVESYETSINCLSRTIHDDSLNLSTLSALDKNHVTNSEKLRQLTEILKRKYDAVLQLTNDFNRMKTLIDHPDNKFDKMSPRIFATKIQPEVIDVIKVSLEQRLLQIEKLIDGTFDQ